MRFFVYTSGGAAKRAITLMERCNKDYYDRDYIARMNIAGVLDDDLAKIGDEVLGNKVVGDYRFLDCDPNHHGVVIPIASPAKKIAILNKIKNLTKKSHNYSHRPFIDPTVIMNPDISIGNNALVSAYSTIMPGVTIEGFVNICMYVSVSHDVSIRRYTTVYNGARISGGVEIKESCIIGTGAIILPNVKIAPGVTIGAGAVVTKDVEEPYSVMVGNPARGIHDHQDNCLCSNV